mgnify:CR=1 FL=1
MIDARCGEGVALGATWAHVRGRGYGVSVAMQYVDTAQQQEGDAVIAHARRHYV